MTLKTFRTADLFSGIGGFSLGSLQAGYSPLLSLDIKSDCCNTLNINNNNNNTYPSDWQLINSNINNVNFSFLEGVIDLLCAGPPCQPFSNGGKHRSHQDSRNMFPELIRAISEIRPKTFIIENVKGLSRPSFSQYFEYLRLQLTFPEIKLLKKETQSNHFSRLQKSLTSFPNSSLKYNLMFNIINASDYGISQQRERIFIVGFRSDIDAKWSFPKPTHSREALYWDQAQGQYWDRHSIHKPTNFLENFYKKHYVQTKPNLKPWNTVRDAISDLPDLFTDAGNHKGVTNHEFKPGAKIYPGHTGSPLDLPSKTIKAGVNGVPGGENMLVNFDRSVRYFTIRELARLQSFPDNYTFPSSWGRSINQLGNAVPVSLAKLISISIKQKLSL